MHTHHLPIQKKHEVVCVLASEREREREHMDERTTHTHMQGKMSVHASVLHE